MADCCVIIPCFNEASRLDGRGFSDYAAAHPDVHFLFVNDGSSDATGDLLAKTAATRPAQLRAMNLHRNGGKAEAVRLAALSIENWKTFAFVGYLDADLAAPLETIAELRSALETDSAFQFAMGSRVALLGRRIQRKAWRHYLGRVFATVVSMMLKLPVYDTQCGAKLFRADLVRDLFAEPFVTRWFFDVELLFRLLHARGRGAGAAIIVEVPLLMWIDPGGSKVRFADFLRTPFDLLRIWRHYRATSGR